MNAKSRVILAPVSTDGRPGVMFEYMHCRNMEVHVSCHRRGQPSFVALEKLPHCPAPSHREQN